jgi:flagellar basal body-associated protein FliL
VLFFFIKKGLIFKKGGVLNTTLPRRKIITIIVVAVILIVAVILYFYFQRLNTVSLGEENPPLPVQTEKINNPTLIPENKEAEPQPLPSGETE